MAGEFWLDDQQWAVIAPLLPTNQPGAHRTDDRRVISGIVHVLKTGSPVEGLSRVLRACYNHLQSVSSLVGTGKYGGDCLKP